MPFDHEPAPWEPMPALAFDPPHQHAARCFWDVAECRWACGSPPAVEAELHPITRSRTNGSEHATRALGGDCPYRPNGTRLNYSI